MNLTTTFFFQNNRTTNSCFAQWLGLGFFLRKNAVHSNLIFIFVMFSLKFQATEQSSNTLCASCVQQKNYQKKTSENQKLTDNFI
jgi:hypothetical protein